jgi:hypothetical protein
VSREASVKKLFLKKDLKKMEVTFGYMRKHAIASSMTEQKDPCSVLETMKRSGCLE